MIKGLRPTLAEAGKIKIGELGPERPGRPGKQPWRPPVKLDHFRITGTTRDQNGDLKLDTALMDVLDKDDDGKIRRIPIVLHSDSVDEIFPTSYAFYAGKRIACRGDGESAVRWSYDAKGRREGGPTECSCTCSKLDVDSKEGKCKPSGTLHCSIVAAGLAIAGSVHKWRTTSWISVQRMFGSFEHIKCHVGALRGLPLWLVLSPVQVTPPGAPASTVYCCHLELRATDLAAAQNKMIELARMRQSLAGLSHDNGPRMLVAPPAGDDETPEEQEEIAQEFYPEEPEETAIEDGANDTAIPTKTQGVLAQINRNLEVESGFEPGPEPGPAEPEAPLLPPATETAQTARAPEETLSKADLMAEMDQAKDKTEMLEIGARVNKQGFNAMVKRELREHWIQKDAALEDRYTP